MINNKHNLTRLQSSALDAMGIAELNAMQTETLEMFRKGESITVLSPTGSGKTLAYLLPILEILQTNATGIQVVIVLPTRELARQVTDVWKRMNTGYNALCLYGGHSLQEECSLMQASFPAVIMATPGRLNDHLSRKTFATGDVKAIILDEFDKALEFGFREEMEYIISKMPVVAKRFFFSATDSDELYHFADKNGVTKLDFTCCVENPQERISFFAIKTTMDSRFESLASLLCLLHRDSTIVFCNFREMAENIHQYLRKKGISTVVYHGGMEQKQRELSLSKFRSGCALTLVCTDLASRGLDIPEVKNVIHFQHPVNEESFIHRNGRTARWDAGGSVFLFFINNYAPLQYMPAEIPEFNLSRPIPMPQRAEWTLIYIGKGKRDKISRADILGFFCKKGGLKKNDVGTITLYERYSYVAVKRETVKTLLSSVAGEKIKGIKTIIEEIKY